MGKAVTNVIDKEQIIPFLVGIIINGYTIFSNVRVGKNCITSNQHTWWTIKNITKGRKDWILLLRRNIWEVNFKEIQEKEWEDILDKPE